MVGRVLVSSLFLAVGCASSPDVEDVIDEASPTRIELRNYFDSMSNDIERASDKIVQMKLSTEIDRNTIYWKMRVIPAAQRALRNADDKVCIMDLWLLGAAATIYIEEKGEELFGDGTPVAQEAAKEIEAKARLLAKSILTEQEFQAAEKGITAFLDEHVQHGDLEHVLSEQQAWGQVMTSVLKKPLDALRAPFSGLNPSSGLSDTAAAVHRFTGAFELARTDIEYLPRQTRWQIQLLLLEIEEQLEVASALAGIAEIGASSTALAETAQKLPGELRNELTAFVEDLDANQANLQTTLKEANATAASFDELLTTSEKTAQSLDAMGQTWTVMFQAFTTIVEGFKADPSTESAPAATPEERGPPYDINDYARTAEKLTETATALTAMLAELQTVTGSKDTQRLLEDAEGATSSVVNRAILGGGVLILFGAVVGFVYRAAVARFTKPAS